MKYASNNSLNILILVFLAYLACSLKFINVPQVHEIENLHLITFNHTPENPNFGRILPGIIYNLLEFIFHRIEISFELTTFPNSKFYSLYELNRLFIYEYIIILSYLLIFLNFVKKNITDNYAILLTIYFQIILIISYSINKASSIYYFTDSLNILFTLLIIHSISANNIFNIFLSFFFGYMNKESAAFLSFLSIDFSKKNIFERFKYFFIVIFTLIISHIISKGGISNITENFSQVRAYKRLDNNILWLSDNYYIFLFLLSFTPLFFFRIKNIRCFDYKNYILYMIFIMIPILLYTNIFELRSFGDIFTYNLLIAYFFFFKKNDIKTC